MNGDKDTQQMQQPLKENGREEKVHSYLMPEGINRQLCHTLKSGASVLSHSIAQLVSRNSLASSSLFFSLLFDNLSRIFLGFLFSLVPVAYRRK